jgi:hypothetical protein
VSDSTINALDAGVPRRAVVHGTKDDFTPANPVVEYNLAFKTAPLAMAVDTLKAGAANP